METKDRVNIRFGVVLAYVSMLLSFLGTLLITNRVLDYIGDYNYGLYSFVGSITSWLTIVASALNASFLRFTSIEAAKREGRIGRTNTIYFKLLSSLGCMIVVLGLSTVVLLYLNHKCFGSYSWEESKLMYILFALSIINIGITTSFTVFSLFINYNKKFIFEKSVSIIVTILNYVGQLLIAFITRSIVLISAYSIFVTIVTVLCNVYYSKKKLNIGFEKALLKENKPFVKSIIIFSSVLIVNSIVDQINSNVDKTLLGIFSVPEDITVYQMGLQFSSYLGVMVVAISGVFAPTINELVVNGRKKEIDHLFLKVSRIQAMAVCFIAFGFIACGKDFIVWWIGDKRINAYYVGAILMLLNIMPLSIKTSIDIQRAMNKHYFRSFMFFIVALLNVVLSIVFLKIFPSQYSIFACLLGSVIASLLTQWIGMNIYNWFVIKLPMKALLAKLFLYIGYGTVCVCVVILLKHFLIATLSSSLVKFIIEMIVYSMTYICFLFLFDKNFILEYFKKKKKN